MPTITGILVDVSGSMKDSVYQKYNQKGGSWSRSIIKVVDELIKEDVSDDNIVFAAAFGACRYPVSFDLLNTIKEGLKINTKKYENERKGYLLEQILHILEQNGAPNVRNWAKLDDLSSVVQHEQAKLILSMLNDNYEFRCKFVSECLPEQCRVWSAGSEAVRATSGVWGLFIPRSKERWDGATRESIEEAVEKGISLIWKICSVRFGTNSIMGVQRAHGILHECTDDREMSDEQRERLMKTVDPFIYGATPMKEAVEEATRLFARAEYSNYNKLLFILSDGMPSNKCFRVTDQEIVVVSCFITFCLNKE